jgi:hypothetical protein
MFGIDHLPINNHSAILSYGNEVFCLRTRSRFACSNRECSGAQRCTGRQTHAAKSVSPGARLADAARQDEGPDGRKWGEVIRVHIAPNGNIWVFHRCFNDQPNGDATCLNRGEANPPILEFDPTGRLLKSLGVGLLAKPHGFRSIPGT